MAKIFDEEQEHIENAHEVFSNIISTACKLIIFFMIIFLLIIYSLKQKKEMEKPLYELVVMENNHVLTKKVKYETYKKTDPSDSSDIYFEVVNSDVEKYPVGCLVKFSHAFYNETSIESETFCVLDVEQIQFKINKEDVKESLLKR